MQEAFGTVLWVVCIIGIVVAVAALATNRRTWEDYGKNRLLLDREVSSSPKPGSAAALLERDTEIRQLLEARNARRLRRGEQPLDVERELKRLTAPAIDASLHAEIRSLVLARNHRRAKHGQPPLDVDAEIQREIDQLAEWR